MSKLDDYALFTDSVWKSGVTAETMDERDTAICALGLGGEAGEVQEHFKKHFRDGRPLNTDALLNEFGDVLFYLTRLVRRAGFTMDQVIDANTAKLSIRHEDRLVRSTPARATKI